MAERKRELRREKALDPKLGRERLRTVAEDLRVTETPRSEERVRARRTAATNAMATLPTEPTLNDKINALLTFANNWHGFLGRTPWTRDHPTFRLLETEGKIVDALLLLVNNPTQVQQLLDHAALEPVLDEIEDEERAIAAAVAALDPKQQDEDEDCMAEDEGKDDKEEEFEDLGSESEDEVEAAAIIQAAIEQTALGVLDGGDTAPATGHQYIRLLTTSTAEDATRLRDAYVQSYPADVAFTIEWAIWSQSQSAEDGHVLPPYAGMSVRDALTRKQEDDVSRWRRYVNVKQTAATLNMPIKINILRWRHRFALDNSPFSYRTTASYEGFERLVISIIETFTTCSAIGGFSMPFEPDPLFTETRKRVFSGMAELTVDDLLAEYSVQQ